MVKWNHPLSFIWQAARLHLQHGYRVPFSVHVMLTNRCNSTCVYCNIHKRPQDDMLTTEILKKVMAEMKACGTQRIQFTGGEPMLRPDIGELIYHAKKLGFFTGISTNGHKVAEKINELKRADIVYLSYDGPFEVHSRLRGKENASEVLNALRALKKAGITTWTTTVLTRWNMDFIEDIVEFARKQEIISNFTLMEFFSDPQNHFHPFLGDVKDLLLKSEQRKACFRKLIQ